MKSTCLEICGDGLLIGSEACDDGNQVNDDGCDCSKIDDDNFECQSKNKTEKSIQWEELKNQQFDTLCRPISKAV